MAAFHIHIDAACLSAGFENYVASQLAFRRTDFVSPDGGPAEPVNHLTAKTDNTATFRRCFADVVAVAQLDGAMTGYIEGEVISLDKDLPTLAYHPGVPEPFKLVTSTLPPGAFRQSEIHIALCAERSDPRLLRALKEMGFLSVYMPKPWGLSIIFTAQGTLKIVRSVLEAIVGYLAAAGGAVQGSIKEELIAKWWVSPGKVSIPHVVETIRWNIPTGTEQRIYNHNK